MNPVKCYAYLVLSSCNICLLCVEVCGGKNWGTGTNLSFPYSMGYCSPYLVTPLATLEGTGSIRGTLYVRVHR